MTTLTGDYTPRAPKEGEVEALAAQTVAALLESYERNVEDLIRDRHIAGQRTVTRADVEGSARGYQATMAPPQLHIVAQEAHSLAALELEAKGWQVAREHKVSGFPEFNGAGGTYKITITSGPAKGSA